MSKRRNNILVVDDTPASLKLLSDLLKAEGYEVRSAISGELAIASAIDNPPDLMLLDILMPDMGGFEVCRRLKANAATRQVPIIFVSALSETDEKVQGFALGAVDFVAKPYQRDELLARVRTHLEIVSLRNHLEELVEERNSELRQSQKRLQTSLRESMLANAHLRTLVQTIPDLVWLKDPNGVYLACNRQFERFLGIPEAEIIGKTDYDFAPKEAADSFRANDIKALSANTPCANEEVLQFAENGYRGVFETLKTPMFDQDGTLIGVLGIARDISEHKLAEAKIQRHVQLYAALSQGNKIIAQSGNEGELFLRICRAAVELGGMSMAWIGLVDATHNGIQPVASFGQGTQILDRLEFALVADHRLGNSPTSVAIRQASPYWCQDFLNDPLNMPWRELGAQAGWAASASLPLRRDNEVIGAFVLYAGEINAFDAEACDLLTEMSRDINFALDNFSRVQAQKQAEAEIERLAFYDPLTHLPNRRLLYDRLQQAVANNARRGNHVAALFIDLDNFKTLNDTRGHTTGDQLLVEVARRLEACLREGDTVARLGGDEFVVVLNGLHNDAAQAAGQAKIVGDKILSAMEQPFHLENYQHRCSASMGIGLFHDADTTAEDILKCIDTALYQAKRDGRNSLSFYDPAIQARLEARAALENDLRQALDDNQFQLYYQMQVDTHRGVLGAEVLIRWLHPGRGLLPPGEFIPLAEETGLILPIGMWVIETACAQLKAWEHRPRFADLQLAVNVSAPQFHQTDFVTHIRHTLQRYQLHPNRLKLELTESLVLNDIDDTIIKMHQLREIGIHFSMDDFGTGYSSLYYLSKLPIDQLKIDRSFVQNIGITQNDGVIVQTIIGMAESLGIESLAEGVETTEQLAFLAQHGCHFYQGYLFSKPVPLDQFETQLIALETDQNDESKLRSVSGP